MRTFRSTLSYGLQSAADSALGAALDIEGLRRGTSRTVDDLAKLTKDLDEHAFEGLNDVPLAHILENVGYGKFRTLSEVHGTMRSCIRELRTIEVFYVGDFDRMKAFCLELNSALLDSYEELQPRFLIA